MKKILSLILSIPLIALIVILLTCSNNKDFIEINLKSDITGYKETDSIKIPISHKEVYDTIIEGIDNSKVINDVPDINNNNTYQYEITINGEKSITLF